MEGMYWLIAMAIFLVIEMITLGLTTIWFAGGSLAAFIASVLGANIPVQIVVFLVVSLTLLFYTRPFFVRFMLERPGRAEIGASSALIGMEARVTETIDNLQEEGRVNLEGKSWSARSVDNTMIPEGEKVKIEKIKGVKLFVSKM